MKLITELNKDVQVISEAISGGGKDLYLSGTFLQAGVRNRNGRVYPPGILENEVNRYTQAMINKGRALGELNHPPTPQVNPERASHRIVSLIKEGNNYIGKALVLDTPMGKIVKGLVEGGYVPGVSSRGMGTLKKNGDHHLVCEDFHLATAADVVSDPSAPDAFVNGIMENVDWVFSERNGWQAQELAESVRKTGTILTEARRLEVFERFLSHVRNVKITT
jgi:hypothetical protein